jgi:hypothetical protein
VHFLTPEEHAKVAAGADRLLPAAGTHPGAAALGAADYVDGLLGAFASDPPRIWAGGPFSGRHGGPAGFARFTALTPLEELAWRTRIEGSRGLPEREWNGPVRGWQEIYREGLAALGDDFATAAGDEQDRRLDAEPELRDLLFAHACEACYGDPVYGGNPGGAGWEAIGWPGDVLPRGWTDDEVREP